MLGVYNEINLLIVLDIVVISVTLWYLSKKINNKLNNKNISIGKIKFHVDDILGKECEGTIFKGKFGCRPVAIKRLSPEYFNAGKNEVNILLESDYHPNVVHYYCTEQDKKFKYIAFELYAATIQDYVEKGLLKDKISPKDICSQSIKGLQHLHSLGIVHRNIKPQNVLLSIPSCRNGSFNHVRVLISDFGSGKKFETDDGIEPEMYFNRESIIKSIDIFLMGYLFYYVLTNGEHPFGESLRHEARNSDQLEAPSLDALNDNELWKRLIIVMTSEDPEERPPASDICNYPAFWESSTLLSFLQEVCDYVDKEPKISSVMIELEKGGDGVIGNGWLDKIDQQITSELMIYRTYRTDSIRDLLRAFKSNKQYFRELSEDTQRFFGKTPDTYLEYWTTKFPLLVYHTWTAMQCLENEISFVQYFTGGYIFPRTEFFNMPSWLYERPITLHNFLNISRRPI